MDFKTAIELCTGIGTIAIPVAKVVDNVYAIDINKSRIEHAKNNAKLYGVKDKVEFIVGDALDNNLLKKLWADVAILDPDWSMINMEKSVHVKTPDNTRPNTSKMFELTKKFITSNIILRVPKTFTFEILSDFGPGKVENIIWDNRTRFKFAYFLDNISKNSETDVYFNL